MDSVIKAAKGIGELIQKDQRYKKFRQAYGNVKNDEDLQDLLKQLKTKRSDLSQNGEDKESQIICEKIFANDNMKQYQKMEEEMSDLVNKVTSIIIGSVEGKDPNTVSFEKRDCESGCAGCSGCH
ncbi:MAG: YlbF family regulator [Oscillospiraceae bacterium]|nr:YlbF family regulator [Oscillospiraceae bacterium]